MDAKIMSEIWDRLEEQPSEVKLTVLWCLTNSSRDSCGAFHYSPKRFQFQTGLEERWLDETLQRLPRMFLRDGDQVLTHNFIKYQIGVGQTMADNNISKAMIKPFLHLSPRLQEALLEDYPELKRRLHPYQTTPKPSTSPCQGLAKPFQTDLKPSTSPWQALPDSDKCLSTEAVTEAPPTGAAENSLSLSEALPKGLPRASGIPEAQEQRMREKSSKVQRGVRGGTASVVEPRKGSGASPWGASSVESVPEPGAGDPTLAEVLARAAMVGLTHPDAQAFYDHYAGLGWMYRETRMTKWWHWLPRWRARSQSFAAGKNTAPAAGSLAAIDEELDWQENPARREELLKKKAALGGKL